ncbi:MAG: hypothetical protein MZV70_35355 [Desulfobacterales bacterium]|nr:hypothetical protein [Desulfobacterales bacterium]
MEPMVSPMRGQQKPVQGAEHVAAQEPGELARNGGKQDLADLQANEIRAWRPSPKLSDGLPHPFPVRHQIVIARRS